MLDSRLRKAIDEFIQERISDHGIKGTDALSEAYGHLNQYTAALDAVLPTDRKRLLHECENAMSLIDGELQRCYYRAGFADAIGFLFSWRDE